MRVPGTPSSFALRLAPSQMSEAKQLAKNDGISLNHFIEIAVVEKLTRLGMQAHADHIRREIEALQSH